VNGGGKNLQLLGVAPSPGRQPDIHETIAALQREIARGVAVYAPDEVLLLERKLADAQELLRVLTTG
jgi:hypothetical protein